MRNTAAFSKHRGTVFRERNHSEQECQFVVIKSFLNICTLLNSKPMSFSLQTHPEALEKEGVVSVIYDFFSYGVFEP